MNNTTPNISDITNPVNNDEQKSLCSVFMIIGIAVSCICVFIQFGYFVFVPQCRKYDEKILVMISALRIINTVVEYMIQFGKVPGGVFLKHASFHVYIQSDCAMVCWMFVFSKNLYDKVVKVFTFRTFGMVTVSLIIFIVSFPIGLMCPLLLHFHDEKFSEFNLYYYVYFWVKLVVVLVNALIFGIILHIAYKRGLNSKRNIAHFVKATTVAFVLMCVTSLTVLVTDLMSAYGGLDDSANLVVSVFNSFQALLVTIIFIMLANGKKKNAFKNSSVLMKVDESRISISR